MRTTVFVLIVLLLAEAFASPIELSTSEDSQLVALLSNNWYDQLPLKIKNQRA
jgi:hypothetical protein